MRKAKANNLHACKPLGWAGATPLLTAVSRPKFCGVAPARPEPLGAVFCPRAYTDVIDPECSGEANSINERRKAR
jgi:hypothetical protein